MKMKMCKGSKSIAVSVEGKSYRVDQQNGTVDLPNDLSSDLVKHLFSMGWMAGDDSAGRKALAADVLLDADGRAK